MLILTQFVYRLAFGLALAMTLTSPRMVGSGYFRNHAYVLLGLHVLAAALAWLRPEHLPLGLPAAGAAISYVASIAWLYEKAPLGRLSLAAVAGLSLWGGWATLPAEPNGPLSQAVWLLDPAAGGLVLGTTMAAMLLGHWYLNAPEMKLLPLQRLVQGLAAAVLFRIVTATLGLLLLYQGLAGLPDMANALFLLLRWISGLIAPLLLAWMTLQTLKIPNTQSATGILYVAVIVTFVGELTAQLLGMSLGYPL